MIADMARQGQTPFGTGGPRKSSIVSSIAAAALPKKFFGLNDEPDVESGRKSSTQSRTSTGKEPKLKDGDYSSHHARGCVNPVFDENEELEADRSPVEPAGKTLTEPSKQSDNSGESKVPEGADSGGSGLDRDRLDSMTDFMSTLAVKVNAGQNSKQPGGDKYFDLDKNKIRKMNAAVKLNRAIKEKSKHSRLVVMNLPRPPTSKEALGNYMEYLEVMTDGLERVLLVRGSGKEVVTIYS